MAAGTSTDQVRNHIVRRILEGALSPGQRLPEDHIAAALECSRTPVREGLRRLERDGVVVFVPGGGVRLAAPTLQEMIDAYEVRTDLECMAVRKVGEHLTPLIACRIRELTDPSAIAGGHEFPDLDARFHLRIAEESGNAALRDTLELLLARTTVYRLLFGGSTSKDIAEICAEHAAVVEALEQADEEGAAALMRRHLEFGVSEVIGEAKRRDPS
ncbi:MAG: GntR family transcriptional regulator [Synergistales bacterium]|nr:GntR family transcriptional regulator [Synergistales bacterium]